MDNLNAQIMMAERRGETEIVEILCEMLLDEKKKEALREKAKVVRFNDEDY